MKTAKRVLASIVAVLMIVGTCVIAASAAGTLQAQIDGGAATIKLTGHTTESITVNRDITIDLNGYRLLGEPGKAAIRITAGNVTVTNGQVVSQYKNVPSAEMLQNVFKDSPPAIRISGGSLVVDGVRLIGGKVRVPTTTDKFVPSGSGVQSYNGAPVTLKRTTLFGDYGVNNAVRQNPAGGVVTIEDAIILSYTKAVKGSYVVADGSEEIVAADRILGVLNSGITLTDGEKEIVDNVFDERVIIVTKTAETLTSELDETTPLVKKIEGQDLAEIEAPVLDYTWETTKCTDCSYRLVPEAIKLTDGTYAALDAAEAEFVNEDSQIRYRVQFEISDKARPYVESLLAEGLDNPLDGVLGWAGEYINDYYALACNNTKTSYVDSYDELIAELGDLMTTIDEAGNIEVFGQDIRELDEYNEIRKALYSLAGVTGFDAKNTGYDFTTNQYNTIFGTNVTELPEYVGTLDRVQALKDQMEEILGPNLFKNTAAYGDLAVWAVETAYPQLMETLDDVVAKLTDLQDLLNQDRYQAVLDALEIGSGTLGLLTEGVDNAKMIKQTITDILGSGDAAATIDYLNTHKDELKGYVDKAVEVIENWRTYVTPEKFIVDNTYAKAYSTLGPIEIEELTAPNNLHLTITGAGKVAYNALVNGTTRTDDEYVGFRDTFTLTAVPDEGFEFLFWVNKEGSSNRILSTEETFTWVTSIDRDIEAVFNYIEEPVAYFTNPTGDICGFSTVDTDAMVAMVTEDISKPYIAGYGFDGWPCLTDGGIQLTDADNTAYFTGDSAFATLNAYYGEEGAVLLVRPESTSYIVTTKYSKNGGYTVTFIDNGQTIVEEGNYSDIARRTSSYAGDAYWVDANDESKIVCVNKAFPYQIIDSASFKSVQGTCPVDTVTTTTVREENGTVVFYVQRSTNKNIKTTGIVYSVSGNSMPTIGGEGCTKASAKFTDKTGLYAPSVNLTWLGSRTFYARPYIEFADGTIYYGDLAQYN